MPETISIALSASAPTVEEARRAVEAGIGRLQAAGLDIEWQGIRDDRPVRASLGGFEAGVQVDGTLRLYDMPETAEAKFEGAASFLAKAREALGND